ncbi:ABC transporter substrate-binding protein [Streptomyces clavuligerus]|uniref:Secreted protein n=1 Tax=Streptomyces clavuligerus TaxID=1901 RepID=E2Q5I2_STRCL|nr:ABC transporter substrate-binding protein [Streptomyces clavuligerus]ANW18202.1 atrA protein [Streptomyces clavuligerus]AXU12764.1 ABC transporter substrate-binding protein [Streptomyces clavuligerus]EFG09196.1 secreted protein [Streptomyces clavuligerus]MBY6302671.1 ABC transporter substrate-binding protein [Streptomyces clavuligerus]QCS05547.1 ABC transporter substrate-binding protein [Streptomyces clavuligerus]
MTARTTRTTTARKIRKPLNSRFAAVSAIAVAGALLLTGCGDQTDKTSSGGGESDAPSAATEAKLHSMLPQAIRDKGVVRVGSDIAYPPVEFKDDSGATTGIDPDIAAALGKELGVKFEFQNGTFDTLITGLRSKRYDIAMSAMTDTKDRQNGVDSETGKKVGEGVDFVDYFTAGVSIYTPKGKDQGIKTWADLCGKKIAVQRGTVSEDLAKAENKKCGDKGPIKIEAFDNDLEAQTRLRAGGADAGSADFPVAAYAVQKSGGGKDFQLVGEQVEAAPYGIAFAKDNTQLRDAVKAALDAIIKNGEYQKVLDKWGVPAGAVTEAKINGGS